MGVSFTRTCRRRRRSSRRVGQHDQELGRLRKGFPGGHDISLFQLQGSTIIPFDGVRCCTLLLWLMMIHCLFFVRKELDGSTVGRSVEEEEKIQDGEI